MNTRYDLLLCDADNTIFDFEKAEEFAFYDACAVAGMQATPQLLHTYSVINQSLWELLEKGGITQSVLRVRRFELFLEKVGLDFDAPTMATAFTDSLGRQGVPLEGAFEAVERWSKLVPVIIVTNGISKVQHGRMDNCPIAPFLSGLVISEEVGAAKPDPKMLEIGMEMAKVTDKRRVLMLGDSLSSDISAAANAQVDACWYNPKGMENKKGLPVAYEITSLDEVDAILSGNKE